MTEPSQAPEPAPAAAPSAYVKAVEERQSPTVAVSYTHLTLPTSDLV